MPDRIELKRLLQSDELVASELNATLPDFSKQILLHKDLEERLPEKRNERVPEKVVFEKARPALLIMGDSIQPPELDAWKGRLEQARHLLQKAIPSVGRVEFQNHPTYDWNGTAWMIGKDVLVTNRHVALLFAERQLTKFVFRKNATLKQIKARVDLKEEHGTPDERELQVTEIIHIEEDRSDSPDVAFLRVIPADGTVALPDPIPLSDSTLNSQDLVAVIGYPSFDPEELPSVAREVFGGIYSVKRLSPGMVMNPQESDSVSFTHDCSTMGGNSGSVVLSLTTGKAVGLHYAGVARTANYAINANVLQSLYQKYVT